MQILVQTWVQGFAGMQAATQKAPVKFNLLPSQLYLGRKTFWPTGLVPELGLLLVVVVVVLEGEWDAGDGDRIAKRIFATGANSW